MFITKNQNFSSNVLPDKFLAKAHLMQVTKVPSELNAAGEWGKVCVEIIFFIFIIIISLFLEY